MEIVGISLLFAVSVSVVVFISVRKRFRKRCLEKRTNRVILFTKYPSPGLVKTRLIGCLGETGAARLQHYMTDHMLNILAEMQRSLDICVEIRYFGGSSKDAKYWFSRKAQLKCIWNEQHGCSLGVKMANAFKKAFKQGAENVVMIGSDIPGITCELLKEAFGFLQDVTSREKLLLGPALDGGYYLIGLNRVNASKLEKLLDGIDWGTEKVRAQQETKAELLGMSVCHLSSVLQDVDTSADLPVVEECMGISLQQIKAPKLSVIIPVLNEINNIHNTIETVIKNCSWPQYMEIIVCDGGSRDGTFEKVEEIAKSVTKCPIKAVRSSKGRGKQQNVGASHSTGDILIFLHGDTEVPERFFEEILICLGTPGVSAGAFKLDFDVLYSHKCSTYLYYMLKFVRWSARIRAKRYEQPYGDQGIFLTRQMFEKIGGFPEYPIMEEFALVKKLHNEGHVVILETAIITSAKRWERLGFTASVINNIMVFLYWIGVEPATLARLYYKHDKDQ